MSQSQRQCNPELILLAKMSFLVLCVTSPTAQTADLTDGWRQTRLALFPAVFVIRYFLHAYLRIRNRCKSTPVFTEVRRMIWHIYHARSHTTCYY